jgi:hypothetical protein
VCGCIRITDLDAPAATVNKQRPSALFNIITRSSGAAPAKKGAKGAAAGMDTRVMGILMVLANISRFGKSLPNVSYPQHFCLDHNSSLQEYA